MANTAVLVRLTDTGATVWHYKRWDAVACREFVTNDTPGTEERLPHVFLLLLFGASRLKVERFLSEEYETSSGHADGTFPVRVRRRLYAVGSNSIPAGIQTIINTTGRLRVGGPNPDVTWTQLRAFIRNKLTDVTEETAGTTIEDLA